MNLLKPGCSIGDFTIGEEVYYFTDFSITTTVFSINYTFLTVTLFDGNCVDPSDIWPTRYCLKPAVYIDLDDTLAVGNFTADSVKIGKPNSYMIRYIKHLKLLGYVVKIFTARSSKSHIRDIIKVYVKNATGYDLEITNIKGPDCILFVGDRACRPSEIKDLWN